MRKFLMGVVVAPALGCGALGFLAWQNSQRMNSQAVTFVIHPPQATAFGNASSGASDALLRGQKLDSALYAIGRAQGMTSNRNALADLSDIKSALTRLQTGTLTATAADATAKQVRANLDTLRLEPAQKGPMILYVRQAVAVTSWCVAHP